MSQWLINELSRLTGVSVRALHHYDKIGLLKPSIRSSCGYRLYSEKELVTLQQIIALKFFGFGLSQIKTILEFKLDMIEQLNAQNQMLGDQISHLQNVQSVSRTVIAQIKETGSLKFHDLISLIERYRMTEELKKTWEGRALNQAQLTEYLELKKKYPKEFEQINKLNEQINANQFGDPEGPDGQRIVKKFLDISQKIKESFGQYRKLSADILRSMREGKITDTPLTPEGNFWLSKAFITYWMKRWESVYQEIRKNISTDPTDAAGKRIAKLWRELINDHFVGTNPDFAMGMSIWQEVGRQQADLKERKTPPTTQEMLKQLHAKIFFDPDALSWIEKALNAR